MTAEPTPATTPELCDIPMSAEASGHEAGAPRRRRVPLIEPLLGRDFRLMFAGESVSLLGDQFHFVALAWLTLQLTGSGVALGTVLMAAAIPRAVFMLVGGAISDRISPRSLMLVANALRTVVVAALVLTRHVQLWQLYVLGLVFGLVDAFFYPALHTIVPMLVCDEQLS